MVLQKEAVTAGTSGGKRPAQATQTATKVLPAHKASQSDSDWLAALKEENLALKQALRAARAQIAADNAHLEVLKHQSQYDGLTNTPNRLLLQDRFLQALRQAQRSGQLLALLFIDLDHFKSINDHFGHSTGDAVLQSVSQRLQQSIRSSDTLCRYGGDEFVLLLPVLLQVSDASAIAGKIIKAIAAPLQLDGQVFELSGSLGIALYPADGDTISDLTLAADQAMYQAKAQGGGCFVFNGSVNPLTQMHQNKNSKGSAGRIVLQRQRRYE
ncbi:GGDEF domain-containing protein [Rheinheimera sp.]|uniref:GGDEF domain-containing protein n=1 Tax=Rheinheimera sp. TaxID=1869214 RepID=UPI0027BA4410|nr:GGDEF domain-containing protein [Rheinheimera sp.]